MLSIEKVTPLVSKFFKDNPGFFNEFPHYWPEDEWFDLTKHNLDVNLWTNKVYDGDEVEYEYKCAVYLVVDGQTKGDFWVSLPLDQFKLEHDNVLMHNLLRDAHAVLIEIATEYDNEEAQEMLAIIENEVQIY